MSSTLEVSLVLGTLVHDVSMMLTMLPQGSTPNPSALHWSA